MADIIKHMTPDRAFEDAYPQVSSSLANRTAHPVPFEQKAIFPFSCFAFFLHPAAVSHQEDPHLLPRLLHPFLHGERPPVQNAHAKAIALWRAEIISDKWSLSCNSFPNSFVSQERFLPFLDMFQKDSVRVEVCRSIMEVFIK